MPQLNKLMNDLDSYKDSHREMTECIRKFDCDLSLKCNKSALIAIQYEFDKEYINKSKILEVEKRIKGIRDG